MNGMTKDEMHKFKAFKAASAKSKDATDVWAMKMAVSAWVKSARSVTARQRRRMAANAIKFAHSA